jgi:hypothetical protein
MDDQKIGAEGYAAHELVMKSLNAADAEHLLGAGQINQVVCVNDQGAQAIFGAPRAESGGVYIGNASYAALPHAGAGGEDLQSVGAQLSC